MSESKPEQPSVPLSQPDIAALTLEIRNLAHRGWEDRPNAAYLFREIGKRAQRIAELAQSGDSHAKRDPNCPACNTISYALEAPRSAAPTKEVIETLQEVERFISDLASSAMLAGEEYPAEDRSTFYAEACKAKNLMMWALEEMRKSEQSRSAAGVTPQSEAIEGEVRHMQWELESLGAVTDSTFANIMRPALKRIWDAGHAAALAEAPQPDTEILRKKLVAAGDLLGNWGDTFNWKNWRTDTKHVSDEYVSVLVDKTCGREWDKDLDEHRLVTADYLAEQGGIRIRLRAAEKRIKELEAEAPQSQKEYNTDPRTSGERWLQRRGYPQIREYSTAELGLLLEEFWREVKALQARDSPTPSPKEKL